MQIVTSWMEQGITQGIAQGITQGEQSLILRQLTRRIGEVAPAMLQQIQHLSVLQLESLGEALLDFTSVDDLVTWLQQNT